MKLVTIWHAGGAYPERIEPFSKYCDNVETTLIVPEVWSKGLVKPISAAPKQNERFRVRPEKIWWQFKEALHIYPDLDRILSEEAPDALYVLEEYYSLVTFQALCWRNAHCPEVPFLFRTSQSLLKHYPPPFSWLESFVLRNADGAVCINHEAAEIIVNKGFQGLTTIVPDAVDPQDFRPGLGNEIRTRFPEEMPVVGYVGRLAHEKGIETLIRALPGLSKPVTLLLVGAGPEKDYFLSLAKQLDVSDRVMICPPVPRSELPQWMGAMDMFVLPSLTCPHWKEKFGMVVIESMSCGVPIVGSDSGEIPHLIGEDGLVFKEGNVEDLARCLNILLEDKMVRQDYSEKGRRKVLEQFTPEVNVNTIMRFIEKLQDSMY